jgi:hypothetical protein
MSAFRSLARLPSLSLSSRISPVSSVSSTFVSSFSPFSSRPFTSKSSDQKQNNESEETDQEQEQGKPKNTFRNVSITLSIFALCGGAAYLNSRGRNDRAQTNKESSSNLFEDTIRGYNDWRAEFFYSSQKPLLPMEMPDNFGRKPRTLVLNLEKTLIHAEWDRFNGWRVRKRPGVEKFLERAARAGWELVVFSDKPRVETEQTIQLLDRMGLIRHRLYYEDTNMKNWKACKNLDRLCRDPKRILVIDWSDQLYCGHEENVIKVKPFTDDDDDQQLKAMGDLVEKVMRYNVVDTRKVAARVNSGVNPFEEEESLLQWNDAGRGADKKDEKKKSGWNSLLTKSLTQQNKKKLTQEFESD